MLRRNLLLFIFCFFIGIFIVPKVQETLFKKPTKIAVLYIGTNKYIIFWEDFYKTAEKHLFSDSKKYEKHYFLFTDHVDLEVPKNVTKVIIPHEGWPKVALNRYSYFLSIKDKLNNFDYLSWFNGNVLFLKNVDEDLLPRDNEELSTVTHPAYFFKNNNQFTYERNIASTAYIPYGTGNFYFQSGLYVGKPQNFINMLTEAEKQTQIDYDNDIIAVWHDESHFNKYLLNKKVRVLTPNYIWPEAYADQKLNLIFGNDIKIITRDKRKYGGRDFLRGAK